MRFASTPEPYIDVEKILVEERTLENKLNINEVRVTLHSPDYKIAAGYSFYLNPWEVATINPGRTPTREVIALLRDLQSATFENFVLKGANAAARPMQIDPGNVPPHLRASGLVYALMEFKGGKFPAKLPATLLRHQELVVRWDYV